MHAPTRPAGRFFQNQIKSKEEFQARKAELRAAARKRLDQIFEKKGQRLVIDSDDDEFSMCSSELSAWDSDVASISSLQSCAREWREDAHFNAPAEGTLQLGLIAGAVRSGLLRGEGERMEVGVFASMLCTCMWAMHAQLRFCNGAHERMQS